MKKTILTIAAIFAIGFANAQDKKETSEGFAKGDLFISGSVSYSSETTGEEKSNTFEVMPKVGFFATDNIAVGATIGYHGNTANSGSGSDLKTNAFGAGLFGRYYTTPASDFSFFAELGAQYVTAKVDNGVAEMKANGFNVAFTPGVSYFISEHFALEAGIGVLSYGTVKPDMDGAESTDSFNIGLGLEDISLGLVYKF